MLYFVTLLLLAASALTRAADNEGTCPLGGCTENAFVVPGVIVGCWQLLERHQDRDKAVDTLLAYARAGFTAFDTADIYGPSEEILGSFRRHWEEERESSKVDSTGSLRFFTKYVTDDPSAENAAQVNAQSLQKMGVQAADLVQFHWWSLSPDASSRTFLQAGRELSRLKGQGKIKHLAGCNMDTAHLDLMVQDGMEIEANQVQYSLLDRRPEVKLLPYCRPRNIKLLVFGVVAGGLLSDSMLGLSQAEAHRRTTDSVSRRMYWSSLMRWTHDWNLFQELLRVLRDIGKRKLPHLPVATVACAWTLQRLDDLGAGGSLILGVRDARHLEEHSALLNWKSGALLQTEDMASIQAVLDKGSPPEGDIWHQERRWI